MFEAKTPEAAAYLAQRDATEKSRAQIWRRVALLLGGALLVVAGLMTYFALAVGQIDSAVDQIKSVVDNHTTILTNQANCQDESFNAILRDARLALTGDKNPNDYAKAPKSC